MIKRNLILWLALSLFGCGGGGEGGSSTPETSNAETNQTQPTASFSVRTNQLTVTVDASSSTGSGGDLTYQWNFNGEAQRNGQSTSYTFNSDGKKTITLVVTEAGTQSSPVSKSVELSSASDNQDDNTAPVASFSVSADGLSVTVDGSASSDADNDDLTYQWTFDGKAQSASSQSTAQYTFTSSGTKAISLVVNDGKTDSSKATKSVTLSSNETQNTAPVASFTISVSDLTVNVDGSGSTDADNDALTYFWTFDGNAQRGSSSKTAQYTFASAGDKSIALVVNDGTTDSKKLVKSVTIAAASSDYSDELKAIATAIASKNCRTCHKPDSQFNTTIEFGTGSEEDIEKGIEDYLKEHSDDVELVKGKPTGKVPHTGQAPFENDPTKTQWETLVDGIAQGLTASSGKILFAEDYEDQTVGENPSGWGVNYQYNVVDNPPATRYADSIKVVDTVSHSGSRSLYVNGNNLSSAMRYSFKKLDLPNDVERVFVRYYLRSKQYIGNRATNPGGGQPNHNHFMALENGTSNEIRIGEMKGALGVNEFGRDDLVPKSEYWYAKITTDRINADTWYCVETAFLNDGDKPMLKTWLNGKLITLIDDKSDFQNGAAPEKWLDNKFGNVAFGWANYGTYDNELYFDDIVVSNERVGCLN